MKKFLCAILVVILIFLSGFYAVYFKGFYIDFYPNKTLTTSFKTDGKNILVQNKDGQYEPMIIKGIDLPSSTANHYATDYAINYETYMRWFQLMSDMGANVIRIYTIYNDTFYDAFYDYNVNNDKPLYLLQGLQVSEWANNSRNDAYSMDFYDSLKKDCIDIVDVIHGNKIIATNKMKGSGIYTKDISPWVLGYIVGNEWNSGTIAYTNHQDYSSNYQGDYISTCDGATAFEALLADVMDTLIRYESQKYKQQRLITVNSTFDTDPFEYNSFYAKQMSKYVSIDMNHFVADESYLSGMFASYYIYDYYENFYNYFSTQQKQQLGDIINHINTSNTFTAYASLLNQYHTMPVVVSGYGYSSSRGTDRVSGPLNEKQQGEALIRTYQDFIDNGLQGAFIDSWQETWEKRMWNTSYAVQVNEMKNWHDIQSESTGYGLLSFASHENTMNGSMEDWPWSQHIKNDDISLYAFSDEIGLYLYIENENLENQNDIYIPIDVTPNSGTKKDEDLNLLFSQEADFFIHIDRQAHSEIKVHSRYESLRANYLYQIQKEDPYIEYPAINDPHFVSIYSICENKNIADPTYTEEQKAQLRMHDIFWTGKLLEANEQNGTLADYAFQNNSVEIRIPWQLLNFSNPIDGMIHDDYYVHYGVESMKTSKISIGVGFEQNQMIVMDDYAIENTNELTYHEYLKESYEIVKNYWSDSL